MVTLSPAWAVAPVPSTMSCLTSWAGGLPDWRGIWGFLERSLVGDGLMSLAPPVADVVSVWVSAGGVPADSVPVVDDFLSSLPQPATAKAARASSRARERMAAEASARWARRNPVRHARRAVVVERIRVAP